MINGKTKTGFQFSVDENCMNDMELVDILADVSVDEAFRMSALVKRLLPNDQRKALYDHVRVNGRVPVDAIIMEVESIFDAMGIAGKNF
jgi:hypothetical protein